MNFKFVLFILFCVFLYYVFTPNGKIKKRTFTPPIKAAKDDNILVEDNEKLYEIVDTLNRFIAQKNLKDQETLWNRTMTEYLENKSEDKVHNLKAMGDMIAEVARQKHPHMNKYIMQKIREIQENMEKQENERRRKLKYDTKGF